MAMIPCPECAQPVSEAAASCPKCGHPLKRKPAATGGKNSQTLIVALVAVVLVAGGAAAMFLSQKQADLAPEAQKPAAYAPVTAQTPAPANSNAQAASQSATCTLGHLKAGPISVDMTLEQARQAWPEASFKEFYGAELPPAVEVSYKQKSLMMLYPLDFTDDNKIDWSKKIFHISVTDPSCVTPEGVGPGALLSTAEKSLGPVTKIALTETGPTIVEFERMPESFSFRLELGGAEFPEGKNETTKYRPDARLGEITIRK